MIKFQLQIHQQLKNKIRRKIIKKSKINSWNMHPLSNTKRELIT